MYKNAEKPVLTISILISNRPETVRKCLDGLKPLMEAIPCELILTDTSKSADIHKMLLEYTDQVYEFEWCNDFAKARNLGLSKAKGQWFMYCDDDEWFVDLEDMIHFFKSGEYKEYGFANYITRDFIDPGLTYYSDSWASRMFCIERDTRFKSKIHEHFEPVRGKMKSLYSKTHHVGYIYKTQEDLMKHFHRNEPLLREMEAEEPENLRWQMQLVQEYRNIKDWDRVCRYCREHLEATKHINNPYDNVHMGTFYVGYAEALVFQKDYQKCIEVCQSALADKRNSELARTHIYMKMMEAHFWLREYDKARECVDYFFQAYEKYGKDEQILAEQKVALIVNEVFDETNIKKAYSILIGCDMMAGSTDSLHQYYEQLGWKRDVIYVYDGIETVLVEAMAKLPYELIFSEIVTDAYNNIEFRNLMCAAAQKWEENTECFNKIMYAYALAEVDDWYIWYAKIYTAKEQNSIEDIKEALHGFFEATPNVLLVPNKVFDMAKELGVWATEEWKEVEADRWTSNVQDYFQQAGKEHVENVANRVKETFSQENWKYQYFVLMNCAYDVGKGPAEPWDLEQYCAKLEKYVEKAIEFYGNYYKEEIFMKYPEVLPKNAQVAIKIMEFLEIEQQDKIMALESLKEAAILSPEMAGGIKQFLTQYPELEKQRERRQREELRKLRDQVVVQVKGMLEQGQAEQALVVIGQLKQMVPDDLEVLTLGLEAKLASLSVNE